MLLVTAIYSPLEQFEVFMLFAQNTVVDNLFVNLSEAYTTLLFYGNILPYGLQLDQCSDCMYYITSVYFGDDDVSFLVRVMRALVRSFFWLLNFMIFSNFTLFLILIVSFLVFFPLLAIQRDPFSTLFRWSGFWVRVMAFVANLAKSQLGRSGQRLFPILYVVFTFICGANLVGMIPYSFTVTSHIFVTFTLSGIMFLNTIFLGVRYNGVLFLRLLLPAGSPMRLAPLLVGVEFVSFLARVFSLAIRLFANMMSGHTLLKILAKFAWDMLKGGAFGIIGALRPCFLVFFVTRLEVGIAVLQAYVFTLLVSIYFSEAKRGGH